MACEESKTFPFRREGKRLLAQPPKCRVACLRGPLSDSRAGRPRWNESERSAVAFQNLVVVAFWRLSEEVRESFKADEEQPFIHIASRTVADKAGSRLILRVIAGHLRFSAGSLSSPCFSLPCMRAALTYMTSYSIRAGGHHRQRTTTALGLCRNDFFTVSTEFF
jgi:hypothetical protein